MVFMGILVLLIGAASLFYSLGFAFRQRGPLLTKFYFDAKPELRQAMKTPANYRFIGVIFLLIAAMFLFAGVVIFLKLSWGIPVVAVLAAAAAVLTIIMMVRFQLKHDI